MIPAVRYVNKDKKLTIDEIKRNNDYGKPKRRKRDVDNELKHRYPKLLNINGNNNETTKTNHKKNNDTKKVILNKHYVEIFTNQSYSEHKSKLCGILLDLFKQYLTTNNQNQSRKTNFLLNIGTVYDKIMNIKNSRKLFGNAGQNTNKVDEKAIKSRSKRGILDILQNSYVYWMNRFLGIGNNRRAYINPKFKIVNGLKYIYYPVRPVVIPKAPKETQTSIKVRTVDEGFKPIVAAEDFNKGEILETSESRMNKKKFNTMKNTVNDTMDDNPWQ